MAEDSITGGCLCGAVRFTATPPVVTRRQCWCRVCQYLSCGSGSTNIIVMSAGLFVTGELSEYRSIADSGNHMVRSFCTSCGTQMFSAATENPDYVVVRAGALDVPDLATPEVIIWADSAPGWACFDRTVQQVPRQPGPVG